MTFVWLTIYAVVLSRIQEALIKARAQRLVEGITGAALIALGLRLASVER